MAYDQKRVVDAIRAFEAGEIVVVTDDDDRENEGDLIISAVHCTPEKNGADRAPHIRHRLRAHAA